MRIVFLVLLTAVAACNNIQSSNTPSGDSTKPADPAVQTDFTKDSVFTIHFPKDSSSVTVTGKMSGINKPVTVTIPVTKGSLLTVSVTPDDSVANIRINQLFTPDGKADGPFGRSLSRKITQQGDYKLIIGENLMQGDEWKGKFTLMVKVE